MEVEKLVKFAFSIALAIALMYCTYTSFLKYQSTPIATNVIYKFGDDDNGTVRLPLISFCPLSFFQLPKEFGLPLSASFLNHSLIVNFIAAHGIEAFLKAMSRPMEEVISANTYNFEKDITNEDGFWQITILSQWGICYTFNTSNVEDFSSAKLGNKPKIGFTIPAKNNFIQVIFFLHSVNDFPDMGMLYPNVNLLLDSGSMVKVGMAKRVLKSISTPRKPCSEIGFETCKEAVANRIVWEKYGCANPLYWANANLIWSKQWDKFCNGTVLRLIEFSDDLDPEWTKKTRHECVSMQACHQDKYSLSVEQQKLDFLEETIVVFSFNEMVVEYAEDVMSYDFFSFIGECGGILGLTLGMSGLSLVEIGLEALAFVKHNFTRKF